MPENLDKYGIPNLQKALIKPDELWPYDERRKSDEYYQDLPKNVSLRRIISSMVCGAILNGRLRLSPGLIVSLLQISANDNVIGI